MKNLLLALSAPLGEFNSGIRTGGDHHGPIMASLGKGNTGISNTVGLEGSSKALRFPEKKGGRKYWFTESRTPLIAARLNLSLLDLAYQAETNPT